LCRFVRRFIRSITACRWAFADPQTVYAGWANHPLTASHKTHRFPFYWSDRAVLLRPFAHSVYTPVYTRHAGRQVCRRWSCVNEDSRRGAMLLTGNDGRVYFDDVRRQQTPSFTWRTGETGCLIKRDQHNEQAPAVRAAVCALHLERRERSGCGVRGLWSAGDSAQWVWRRCPAGRDELTALERGVQGM
jgi:hypothetical protein